jgi:hypothetical protein
MKLQWHTCVSAVAGLLAGALMVSAANAQGSAVIYKAELSPLNSKVTGSDASGEATFTVSGDQLTIRISIKDVPPNMEHWQHFHGFAKGDEQAQCPTVKDDTNGDGIIDLIETEPKAGTTMAPFNADPAAFAIPKNTYPQSDVNGSYTYEKTVSLKALQTAFEKQFPGQELDLDRRVVFIHGVPSSTKLPPSVASLGDITAQVTLPIACGEIRKSGN